MKIVVLTAMVIALVWYLETHQNMRIGGTQLLTPLFEVSSTLGISLLVIVGFLEKALCPTSGEKVDNNYNEGKISRKLLREYLADQDCTDISEVQRRIPCVYQDLQDYAKNHRFKEEMLNIGENGTTPTLPVLDPQILRRLEDISERKHGLLCGASDPDYMDGELELFGHHGTNSTRWHPFWYLVTIVCCIIWPFHGFNLGAKNDRERRQKVRRKRQVARKLEACLYIRAWVRSVLSPESLRVELDDDGEMFIDLATSQLVDNKLREFFKLHCFDLQSIAEYQDLARIVVFYTNQELGISAILAPRLGKPLSR